MSAFNSFSKNPISYCKVERVRTDREAKPERTLNNNKKNKKNRMSRGRFVLFDKTKMAA